MVVIIYYNWVDTRENSIKSQLNFCGLLSMILNYVILMHLSYSLVGQGYKSLSECKVI